MWATLHDSGSAGVFYPIIGFANNDPANFNGGTARYRVWDPTIGYVDLATPVAFDAWTDFCVTYTGSTLEYRIGDTLVYTDTNPLIATAVVAADVMLQGYNFDHAYTSHWSHVGAGNATCAQLRAEFAPPPPPPPPPPLPPPATPPQPVPVGPFAPLLSALAIAFAFIARQRASRRR